MSYYVPAGNWTNVVTNEFGTSEIDLRNFTVNIDSIEDPAPGCEKEFTSNYSCGLNSPLKSLSVSKEANGGDAQYDCSTEANQCNNTKLTLYDDGRLTLTTFDGSTTLWDSVANGNKSLLTNVLPADVQLKLPDDNDKPLTIPAFAGDGQPHPDVDVTLSRQEGRKYPYNYLLAGQMLKQGQWIGSPSGTCRLMMGPPGFPNSLQVVMNVLGCSSMDGTPLGTPDTACARLYTIPKIHNEYIGKVAYVNNLGQLQQYPDETMTSYGTQFEKIAPGTPADGGYSIDGATIGAPFHADTPADCQKKCTMGGETMGDTQKCAGVIFDTRAANSATNCQMLDKGMYGQHRIIDKNYQYYIRQKGTGGSKRQDSSCPYDVSIETAGFWEDHVISKDISNNMTPETKCGLANYVASERNQVSTDLPTVYSNLQYKDKDGVVRNYKYMDASGNVNPKINNTSGFKFWYETLENKYAKLKDRLFNTNTAIDSKFNQLQASRKDLADWTGEQLQNLTAMNEDRDLNMMSQNYRHIMWSILAILIIIGTIKLTKSASSGKGTSAGPSAGPGPGAAAS